MLAILDSFVFRIVPHSRSRDVHLQIRPMAPRSLYSLRCRRCFPDATRDAFRRDGDGAG